MAAIENVEWLNRNLLRSYPIREDANTTPLLSNGTRAGGLSVPTCLITDFAFTLAFSAFDGLTSSEAIAKIPSLTGLSHAGDGFSLEISCGSEVLATLTADISTHTLHRPYLLSGVGDNADCAGWIVLGDLARAAEEIPEGVYRFTPGQIPFEVSTLRMAPRGVRSLTAVGKYGLTTYAPLYGNVKLIAGSDMSVLNDGPANAIWLQAESSSGYERTTPCACSAAQAERVYRVNGMEVTDFHVVSANDCVSVTSGSDGTVEIEDTCATPCCGCSDLNFVESAVATINRSITTLNSYAEALRRRVEELQSNWAVTQSSAAAYPTT